MAALGRGDAVQQSEHQRRQGLLLPAELAGLKKALPSTLGAQEHQETIPPKWVAPVIQVECQAAAAAAASSGTKKKVTIRHQKIKVTTYFFQELEVTRKTLFSNEHQYNQSLRSLSPLQQNRGRSRAVLTKSADGKLIAKQVTPLVFYSFKRMAGAYFSHIKEEKPTALARVLGVYRVKVGTFSTTRIIVMEAVAPLAPMKSEFDLKGVMCFGAESDADFVKQRGCILLEEKSRKHLFEALDRDTCFLAEQGIVDYSLLVVESTEGELVGGIIDYMMPYFQVMWLFPLFGFPLLAPPTRYRTRMLETFRGYFPA